MRRPVATGVFLPGPATARLTNPAATAERTVRDPRFRRNEPRSPSWMREPSAVFLGQIDPGLRGQRNLTGPALAQGWQHDIFQPLVSGLPELDQPRNEALEVDLVGVGESTSVLEPSQGRFDEPIIAPAQRQGEKHRLAEAVL